MKIDKKWGYEKWLVNEPEYCGKLLAIKKDSSGSLHYHKVKKETFIAISGVVKLEVEGDEIIFNAAHDPITILPNQKHRFTGIVNSTILEVSTHHDDEDTYRIEESK